MLHLLYNPLADGGKGEEDSKAAVKVIIEGGKEVKAHNTVEENIDDIVSKMAKEDEIALLGGDGTLNYFINHVKDIPSCKIYLYPSGTGNDFLNDIEEKTKPEGGLYRIDGYLHGLPRIEVKGKTYRFLNGIGFGIDGECCVKAEEMRKEGKTDINYSSITIKLLLTSYKARTATIRVDGAEPVTIKKAYLASAMNGRFYGGHMNIAPNQSRGGGTLTCVVMHGLARLPMLMAFPGMTKGKHVGKKYAYFATGKTIEIEFDEPCGLQIDGEVVDGVKSYKAYID